MPTEEILPRVVPSQTEHMVFSVASYDPSHAGKRYRVDLLANRGAGWCSCKAFLKCQRAINQAMPLWTRQTACKHLLLVFRDHYRDVNVARSKIENAQR